jgi:hypothetical protein
MPFWYWAAIGAVLGVIEVAIPATICIWLGVAAIAWRYPGLAWERQALIFSALAVTSIVFGRTACARVGSTARDRHLNRRDESYVGRVRERPRQRVGAVDAAPRHHHRHSFFVRSQAAIPPRPSTKFTCRKPSFSVPMSA